MPKWLMPVILLVVAGFVLIGCPMGTYNGVQTSENRAERELGVVQSQLQRRSDLIPNLVATVRGYAAHERETLEAVIAARQQIQALPQVDPGQLARDPAAQQRLIDANNSLGGALSRLMVVVERYPDLKANEQFLALQTQLEGTENRIAVARRDWQVAVENYNNRIETIPGVFMAGFFNWETLPYYEATAPNAEQAPTVDFSPDAAKQQ